MGDVTHLDSFRERKSEFVFECRCGGQHFYLHQDGCIECRDCKQFVSKLEWIYRDMKEPA